MTIEITDEMVEQMKDALAELFNQRLGPEDAPYIPSDFNGLAEDELTAVLPIIEKQVRAACAEEIRAIEIPEHNLHDQLPSDHWYAGQKIMRDEIAALLEGGTTTIDHQHPKVVFEPVLGRWRVEYRTQWTAEWQTHRYHHTLEEACADAQEMTNNDLDGAYRVVDTQPDMTTPRLSGPCVHGHHDYCPTDDHRIQNAVRLTPEETSAYSRRSD